METPAERITGFLASNASRVMDLLIAWDKDKNGLISRQEFYAFIKGALGFVVKREVADSLFVALPRTVISDSVQVAFDTRVLLDHCAGVAPDTTEAALAEMTSAGIELV